MLTTPVIQWLALLNGKQVLGLNSEIAWDFSVKGLHVLPMQLVGLG